MHLLKIINQFSVGGGTLRLLDLPRMLSSLAMVGSMILFQESSKKADVYNILWALVFGFATLNILSLVAKRFDPDRNRMSFGEILAVMTVVVSVVLLGWEMLYLFKILPIHLSGH